MHALIIEDEPIIAIYIEDHLRALGYTSVEFAVTEADAVAAARRRCPELITADVRLQDGCGIAAVRAICNGRRVPVVFVTGTAAEVRERLGAAIVVEKPFGSDHLTEAIFAATGAAARPAPQPAAH